MSMMDCGVTKDAVSDSVNHPNSYSVVAMQRGNHDYSTRIPACIMIRDFVPTTARISEHYSAEPWGCHRIPPCRRTEEFLDFRTFYRCSETPNRSFCRPSPPGPHSTLYPRCKYEPRSLHCVSQQIHHPLASLAHRRHNAESSRPSRSESPLPPTCVVR